MSRETILKAFREQGCRAFQAELAADFLCEDSAPHHLLVTPAGLRKVQVVSQIVNFMVEHGQARRVLVMAPAAFCMLWRTRLEEGTSSVRVELVHTRGLRELEASLPPDGAPWPEAVVAIVPGDAKKSALVQLVSEGEMPPRQKDRLSADEIALVVRWIDAGAKIAQEEVELDDGDAGFVTEDDRRWWAFRRPEALRPRTCPRGSCR